MAIIILKAMTDAAWYLACTMPIITAVPEPARIILLMLPVLWMFYLILFRKKRNFVSDLLDMVLFEARFLLAIGIFELMIIGPAKWQDLCGRPALLFLLSGIFLLRAGRITDVSGGKRGLWSASTFSLFALLFSAVILSSKTVQKSVLWILYTIYTRLFIPVLEILIWLLASMVSALVSFISGFFSETAATDETQELLQTEFDYSLYQEGIENVQTPMIVKLIGYLILILAAAALLFFIYRKISGSADRWNSRNRGNITKSKDDGNNTSPGSRRFFWQERNVRYYYRKLLLLCTEKGMHTEHPLTSTDVKHFSALCWGKSEESEEFKDLYQIIRYGGEQESSEQKARAKELYQIFRSSETDL